MQEISNYAGIILGLLSILATAYFAHRYSEKKLPTYTYRTTQKIQRSKDAPTDIKVLYKGKDVEGIYSTIIWFWNDGRKPIQKADLPNSQPLVLKIGSEVPTEILDVSVLKTSREILGFSADKLDDTSIALDFDFLDHYDGAAIEVLHTGSRHVSPTITGVILGAPQGTKKLTSRSHSSLLLEASLPYLRIRKRSLSIKVTMTILFTLIFGGLAYLILSLPVEITTTEERLKESLEHYISADKLPEAIRNITDNSKYKFLQNPAPLVMAGIFILNMLLGYWVVWRRLFSYPESISIDEPVRETQKHDKKIEQENPADS